MDEGEYKIVISVSKSVDLVIKRQINLHSWFKERTPLHSKIWDALFLHSRASPLSNVIHKAKTYCAKEHQTADFISVNLFLALRSFFACSFLFFQFCKKIIWFGLIGVLITRNCLVTLNATTEHYGCADGFIAVLVIGCRHVIILVITKIQGWRFMLTKHWVI